MKLLFKYPTRMRKEWFTKTLGTYYDKMSDKHPFEFLITLDCDDPQMNTKEVGNFLGEMPNLRFHYGVHKTKMEAINAGMGIIQDWDILVLVSDDMIPTVGQFDAIIVEMMEECFPNMDGALHFNDGLFGGDQCITLSIMGRELYEQFGYIYHPSYKSFYCDNEFTDEVYRMKKVHYDPRVIIKHMWKGGPQADALYRRNTGMGRQDEAVYKRRKAAGFPKGVV